MPRAKFAVARLKRRRRVMRRVKGFRGARSRHLRTAKEAMVRAEACATRHRRKKKGEWRRLWILRISAACKMRGVNYSQFMNGLKKANVELNRKMLSDIAIRNPGSFDRLVVLAKENAGAAAGQAATS